MLVGTVYLFKTMPTGFIPSQDSGFFFGGTLWPARTSPSNPWRATEGRGRRRRSRPRRHGRRRVRAGRQSGFVFAVLKPRASAR